MQNARASHSFSLNLNICFILKATSCTLRHATGRDDPAYAIPAGLVASCAFFSYPDTTVALYAMWKLLQISYGLAEERGWVPHVPHFTLVLYCASTAMLFHAATWEPLTLRQNYWKFLHSLSGGRYGFFCAFFFMNILRIFVRIVWPV